MAGELGPSQSRALQMEVCDTRSQGCQKLAHDQYSTQYLTSTYILTSLAFYVFLIALLLLMRMITEIATEHAH